MKKHKKLNLILKELYKNSNKENFYLKTEIFKKFLTNNDTFYIINSNKKIVFLDIEEFENFYPEYGILSLDINNIINYINSKEYEQNINNFQKMYENIPDYILENMNNVIYSVIYHIDLYRFNYYEDDINEIINFILLNNRFSEIENIDIDDYTLISIFEDRLSLDKDIMFSLFLERIAITQNNNNNNKISLDIIEEYKKELKLKEKTLNLEEAYKNKNINIPLISY